MQERLHGFIIEESHVHQGACIERLPLDMGHYSYPACRK